MGGPGGFGGDMDDSQGGLQGERPDMPKEVSAKDIEKRMKNMEKQEQKLQKTMKKVLVSDDLYNQWLQYHESQKPKRPEDFNRPNQQ
jgi:predicted acetyltransferase